MAGCGCGGSKQRATSGSSPTGVGAEGYYWRGPRREQSGPAPRTERAAAQPKQPAK